LVSVDQFLWKIKSQDSHQVPQNHSIWPCFIRNIAHLCFFCSWTESASLACDSHMWDSYRPCGLPFSEDSYWGLWFLLLLLVSFWWWVLSQGPAHTKHSYITELLLEPCWGFWIVTFNSLSLVLESGTHSPAWRSCTSIWQRCSL
jgi:hypothetical protein